MVRTLLFITSLISFLLHQYLERIAGLHIPAADNYLDPLLLMPILLTLILWERRWLLGMGSSHILSFYHIVGYCLLVALVSEVVFPAVSPTFTSDPWDVVAYMAGSLLFHVFMNSPGEH